MYDIDCNCNSITLNVTLHSPRTTGPIGKTKDGVSRARARSDRL